jgi:hypothetical protein
MTTVWEVASEAETGDRIKWLGEDADVEQPEASAVTSVRQAEGKITVEAEGPRGAEVGMWVKQDGTSKVLHQGDGQGAVDGVELPDKGIGTRQFPE